MCWIHLNWKVFFFLFPFYSCVYTHVKMIVPCVNWVLERRSTYIRTCKNFNESRSVYWCIQNCTTRIAWFYFSRRWDGRATACLTGQIWIASLPIRKYKMFNVCCVSWIISYDVLKRNPCAGTKKIKQTNTSNGYYK